MATSRPVHGARLPVARASHAPVTGPRVYDTQNWRRLRRMFLAHNPLCTFCHDEGVLTPAEHVDHIEMVADRPDLAFDWSNLRGLCQSHHNSRSATDQARLRKAP